MKKLIERLLIFILGIPAVVALVLILNYKSNLAMNMVAVILSGIGAIELSSMLAKKQVRIPKIESFILGILSPLSITLVVSFNAPSWIIPVLLMSGAGWILVSIIFTKTSEIENVIFKVFGSFALIIYPGFFIYWLIKMNVWNNNYIILLFLITTFAYDSFAWLFGTLFGKNNRGIITVSPNKSIAGFIGGILGSVSIVVCTAIFFPQIFPAVQSSYLLLFSVILGFFTSVAATFGDLAESAIKRSCDFKDSGTLMLGRGGVLDSIDSIAVAAPLFYALFHVMFLS